MNCPVCENNLQKITIEGIEFDVCKGGCGGIWFDWFELQKVDEKHEAAGEQLLDIERDPSHTVDQSKKRNCPKCSNVVMMQHFISVKRQIVVDECPKCGGYWLDWGELGSIRNQFDTEKDREKAAQEYFREVTKAGFTEMHEKSEKKLEKARHIAKMFRFICPSNYIPGDQAWGAF